MQDDDDDMVFTVPEHQRRLSIDVETSPTSGIDRIEALNVVDGGVGSSSRSSIRKLRGFSLGVQRWEHVLKSEVCLLKANRFNSTPYSIVLLGIFTFLDHLPLCLTIVMEFHALPVAWLVAACFDGSLLVLSTSSGLLRFTFILDSAPCSLTLENAFSSVITGYGFIYVWFRFPAAIVRNGFRVLSQQGSVYSGRAKLDLYINHGSKLSSFRRRLYFEIEIQHLLDGFERMRIVVVHDVKVALSSLSFLHARPVISSLKHSPKLEAVRKFRGVVDFFSLLC
ncbi:unnamed protein product [Enterobius vermicularis]|uniref:PIG-H domain-containing protein n=1 Tax=Enterobius vermicularis TaxID=51028 RepID=A0A0N4VCB2_ENTVE|nr:unnamed protein product [Enterobius vermicularis]